MAVNIFSLLHTNLAVELGDLTSFAKCFRTSNSSHAVLSLMNYYKAELHQDFKLQ